MGELFPIYAAINRMAFPIAAVAFGIYYARREARSRRFGVLLGLAAAALCLGLSLIGEVMVFWGLLVYASFYLADRKNRSRPLWTLCALVFATPALLVLLWLPPKPPERLSIATAAIGGHRA